MFHSNNNQGFSLIELMVVMAIVAVLLTLTGGIMQQNIAKQERVVELEQVTQLFHQLAYQSYYGKGPITVRLQENKITLIKQNTVSHYGEEIDPSINENELSEQKYSAELTSQLLTFKQLTFVAQDYFITSKGVVSPNTFGFILKNEIKHLPLNAIFNEITEE
ncbi:type II secretion system protein [Thalassotalea sp. SU-HH00458]|uniref:type II secretion system protein n=1 Tax=Thalassotalea sp. SU-HH00458 TaxID=3127657 RepID=UPI003105DCC8